jgi:hypothetical protein
MPRQNNFHLVFVCAVFRGLPSVIQKEFTSYGYAATTGRIYYYGDTYSWECQGIEKPRGVISSLREVVLNLKSQQFPDKSLFISVERAWNFPGVHVFAFMPQMEAEAQHAVTTLFPLLSHHHGTDVEHYFTQSAIRRTEGCIWDEELQHIATRDKVCFDTLHENFFSQMMTGVDSTHLRITLIFLQVLLPISN